MKSYFFTSIVSISVVIGSILPVFAQSEWTDPDQWKSLVNSKVKNPFIKDTILIQGFDEEEPALLDYKISGDHDFIYLPDYDIPGSSSSQAICLYPGSELIFDFPQELYKEKINYGEVHIPFAIQSVHVGEDLMEEDVSSSSMTSTRTPYPVTKDNLSKGFREKDGNKHKCLISPGKTNISKIRIWITESETPSPAGFYCIDSVLMKGQFREYTLLNESGDWHTAEAWSHLYPTPHRTALVRDPVTIRRAAACRQVISADGDIRVYDLGSLRTSQMTIIHSFPEKGAWYFVSFPFDVYQSGIDNRFQLGDDKTVTSEAVNNVLYAQIYDAENRANTNEASGNWRVISTDDLSDDQPVFRKGVGYLLAIDESSDIEQLCFSSSVSAPLCFTSEAELPIEVPVASTGESAHCGWFLCGNPFPSSLSLQDIQSNADLDGYIYVYQEDGYHAYSIGSTYTIPANTSFFVKAKRSTTLVFRQQEVSAGTRIQPAPLTALPLCSEPVTSKEEVAPAVRFRIQDGQIGFSPCSLSLNCLIYTVSGKLIRSVQLSPGTSRLVLPQQSGIYVILLQCGDWKQVFKHKIS